MPESVQAIGMLLAGCLFLALFLDSTAHAMPAARTGDGQPQPIRDGFALGRFSEHVTPEQFIAPYEDLFSTAPHQDDPLLRGGSGAEYLLLSPEEQAEIRALLDPDPKLGFTSPFLQGGIQAGVNTPGTAPLAQQLVQEVDALYDELRSAATAPIAGLGNGPGIAPGTFGGGPASPETGDKVLQVMQVHRSSDLPVLSSLPLGAMFKDAVRDSLDATGINLDTIDGLRDFVLVEERRTGAMMMVDGGSGYTVTLRRTEEIRAQDFRTANGFNNPAHASSALSDPVEVKGPRALHWKIWDVLTSTYAFIVYAVLIVCWASWRYLISRYA